MMTLRPLGDMDILPLLGVCNTLASSSLSIAALFHYFSQTSVQDPCVAIHSKGPAAASTYCQKLKTVIYRPSDIYFTTHISLSAHIVDSKVFHVNVKAYALVDF